MKPPGMIEITDAVAVGIAREQTLTILADLRAATIETDLGPAVLLREAERLTIGTRS